jgi:hypothetical protein
LYPAACSFRGKAAYEPHGADQRQGSKQHQKQPSGDRRRTEQLVHCASDRGGSIQQGVEQSADQSGEHTDQGCRDIESPRELYC